MDLDPLTPSEGLIEDQLAERVPARYSKYLEEENFEKFSNKKKEWEW